MKPLMMRTLLLIAAAGYFFAAFHSVQHLHLDAGGGAVVCHAHHGDPSQHGDSAADDCPICIAHALTGLFITPPAFSVQTGLTAFPAVPAAQTRTLVSNARQSFAPRAPPFTL